MMRNSLGFCRPVRDDRSIGTRWRYRLGALGITAALLALALAACGSAAPELALDQAELDLGQVVNGEIRSFEVAVRNLGNGPLVIEAVSTSCGCTSASIDPSTIQPGESGMLQVRFDSGAHGPEANGPVMRQVFIASNDPDQPETEFRFEAVVVPPSS